jgi:hypothetical protein
LTGRRDAGSFTEQESSIPTHIQERDSPLPDGVKFDAHPPIEMHVASAIDVVENLLCHSGESGSLQNWPSPSRY